MISYTNMRAAASILASIKDTKVLSEQDKKESPPPSETSEPPPPQTTQKEFEEFPDAYFAYFVGFMSATS